MTQSSLQKFLYGPVAASRILLLRRILPFVFALDIWTLMIGHAGRYGIADFNVAHFSILDHLLPVPTAASYIGLLIVAGLLSLIYGLGQRSAGLMLALVVSYTLSWAISMLDSYQHHYFLSLLLVGLACLDSNTSDPMPHSQTDRQDTPSGGGFAMITSSVAILYSYAALAKWDDAWLSGHTLRAISQAETVLEPIAAWAQTSMGVGTDSFYSFVATSVIPLELLLAIAYAISPLRDGNQLGKFGRALIHVGFVLALTLHIGAEGLELKIGWFSYYMLLLAVLCLGPATWLEWSVKPLKILERKLGTLTEEIQADSQRWLPTIAASGVAGLLWLVGTRLDLPGAPAATSLVGGALLLVTVRDAVRSPNRRDLALVTRAAVAGIVLLVAVSKSEARFDFYRFLGGDLARRDEIPAAIAAYEIGERYAPKGKSRARKIKQLRRALPR